MSNSDNETDDEEHYDERFQLAEPNGDEMSLGIPNSKIWC